MAKDTDEKNSHTIVNGDEGLSSVQPVTTNEQKLDDESNEKGMENDLIHNARLATKKEQSMSLIQGIKLYPKAIGWSILISTCIVMEGYDVSLINNFYGNSQFNRKYGEPYINDQGATDYQVSAAWQAGLSNGAVVALYEHFVGFFMGEIIGLMINGYVSERFGYRYTIIACLTLLIGFVAIFFTAQNVIHLQVAEILCGRANCSHIPWGVFQTLTITYASEVCPVALRGYLTTYINACWGFGQLIGIGAIVGNRWRKDEWAYRIPYALQWIWPVPLIVGIFLAPDSPWWQVRHGQLEEAKKSLLRLTSLNRETDFDADETIAMMAHTTALEAKITKGASYWDCFKGVDLRRTEIVVACWAIQNLSGNSFSNYSTYFLQQAGLSEDKAYYFALGQYAINSVGVVGAWTLITLGFGRRTLYVSGLAVLFVILLILGFLGLASDRNAASLATGAILLVWALIYQLTVGTVCYSLVAELSSRRLGIKTIVLGRVGYNIVGIVAGVITPYMLNPTAWNWGNYAGFFWAGSCFLCLIYTYFRVPEPAGRTYAELDLLFEKGISARKFASTKVDVFAENIQGEVMDQYRNHIAISHVEDSKT